MSDHTTYSGNRTTDYKACQACGRFGGRTITKAMTTRGFAVALCDDCLEQARTRGHIRNEAEHDMNVRALRSAPIGQTVTLAGDGIVLARDLDDKSAMPVMIDDGTPKPAA